MLSSRAAHPKPLPHTATIRPAFGIFETMMSLGNDGPVRRAIGGRQYSRELSRCPCVTFEKQDGAFAVLCIAVMIAVNEVRSNFSQVACPDPLITHHAEGLRAGRPPTHQYESHVALPSAKQNTVSDGL
jgi:hypothetical protein